MSDTDATPRQPGPARPTPIGELASLPLFFRLQDRQVLLVGAGTGADWKAELLTASGARVRRIARDWQAGDLAGMALVIADLDDAAEAGRLVAAARALHIPVNIVDKPGLSDFQFGAIVERSPLVIGISTDGVAPILGQLLRARIEALIPQNLRDWLTSARLWRQQLRGLALPAAARRSFWERFARDAMRGESGPAEDFDHRIAALGARPAGSAVLVGAGPGDPELLTLKAVLALQSADVVLYDDLVAPRVLEMARREAERINVGKRGYKPSCTQADISALIVEHARAGKRVVRLKGGDPMIFGRANEEIAALRQASIPYEVVPGVTSAGAAAASLRASLTERDVARRVQFITAHGRDGHLPRDLDWAALADPRATTVVYMGVRTLPELVSRLLAAGLPPTTPAVVVERVSWPGERQLAASIADMPDRLARFAASGPCVIVIGEAMAAAQVKAAVTP
ncbi:MAG: siroheme synthase CysG [Hyphomicrobiales bacterium]|nr:siroheme synthase CysG [Hyphomicrobiales bacterium]